MFVMFNFIHALMFTFSQCCATRSHETHVWMKVSSILLCRKTKTLHVPFLKNKNLCVLTQGQNRWKKDEWFNKD